MRIVQLKSENIKRLKAVDISPDPTMNRIGGANGAGKSSLLDSIAMALSGGEITEMPLRQGEKKGAVVVTLDDGIQIKRTFTAAGGTTLTISNAEGLKYPSPQAMLDKLTGKLMFDPFQFTRLSPKDQAAALKRLVGLDFAYEDASRAAIYNERTLVNRDIDRMRARVGILPLYENVPPAPVSTVELMDTLSAIQKHNAQKAQLQKAWDQVTVSVNDCINGIASLKETIAKLEAALAKNRAALADQEAALATHKDAEAAADIAFKAFVPMDEAAAKAAIAGAADVNAKVEANRVRAEHEKALTETQAKADALTKRIDAIDTAKAEALSKAKFPIEGLSFVESSVTWQGLPFSEASTAEKIRISVAMGAALNPKLRVMIVRDGSLLDKTSMALLAELAAAHNLQVFIEIAGDGEGCEVVIEDGSVKGAAVEDPDFEVADEEPAFQ